MKHLKNSLRTLLLVCTLSISVAADDGIIHGGGDKTTPLTSPSSGLVTESLDGAQTTDTSGGEGAGLVELIIEAGSAILSITFSLV